MTSQQLRLAVEFEYVLNVVPVKQFGLEIINARHFPFFFSHYFHLDFVDKEAIRHSVLCTFQSSVYQTRRHINLNECPIYNSTSLYLNGSIAFIWPEAKSSLMDRTTNLDSHFLFLFAFSFFFFFLLHNVSRVRISFLYTKAHHITQQLLPYARSTHKIGTYIIHGFNSESKSRKANNNEAFICLTLCFVLKSGDTMQFSVILTRFINIDTY